MHNGSDVPCFFMVKKSLLFLNDCNLAIIYIILVLKIFLFCVCFNKKLYR